MSDSLLFPIVAVKSERDSHTGLPLVGHVVKQMGTAEAYSSEMESTIIQRQSLHDALTQNIRMLIQQGELKRGKKIPERELCERFGVSRTPLREALKVLAAEGLVELLPQRGAIVANISREEIAELFPIMAAFEGLAGELACDVATDDEIAQLRVRHEEMASFYEANDEMAYLNHNRLIHETLFKLARNETLLAMYRQILAKIHLNRFIARKSRQDWKGAIEEHEQIMRALEARDKKRLSRLLKKHILGTSVNVALDSLED